MVNFNIEGIIRELKSIEDSSWRIYDRPKNNQIIFYLTKSPRRSKKMIFDRYQMTLARGDREIAEIVVRKSHELEYGDMVMIKLLENI